jgi:hypothetical protein
VNYAAPAGRATKPCFFLPPHPNEPPLVRSAPADFFFTEQNIEYLILNHLRNDTTSARYHGFGFPTGAALLNQAQIKTLLDFIDNPGIFVWEEDGGIVGFSAADPRNGSIFALFVDEAYEGRAVERII